MGHELTEEQIAAVKEYGSDADALLEEASDPSSPLHDLFDWSREDVEAVNAQREIAEALIRDNAKPAGGDDDEAAAAAETAEIGTTSTEAAPGAEVAATGNEGDSQQ